MTVGVAIPVHGFAPFLAEALDCVLATAPDAVVVVDDGSRLPLTLHPDHAGRVTLVRREQAGGPAVARAVAAEALGEVDLVALCDADDAWGVEHLVAHRAAFAEHPDAGWAFGRATIVGPDGRRTGERWAALAAGRHEPAALARELYAANPIPTSSVVVRRTALLDAGGFSGPVRVAEDWELWLRLARAGHAAVCVDGAEIRYRRHPDGLTADVAALARAQQVVHELHGDLVDTPTRARMLAADRATVRGERLRTVARDIPGVGRRRDPYRR